MPHFFFRAPDKCRNKHLIKESRGPKSKGHHFNFSRAYPENRFHFGYRSPPLKVISDLQKIAERKGGDLAMRAGTNRFIYFVEDPLDISFIADRDARDAPLSRMRTFRGSNDDSDPMPRNNNSMRTMPRSFSGETRRNGRKGGRKRDDDTLDEKTNGASVTRAFERHSTHRVLLRASPRKTSFSISFCVYVRVCVDKSCLSDNNV